MKVVQSHQGGAMIEFSDGELYILNNALNEVCNGLPIPEFSTRMGAEREDSLELLKQINQLLTTHET